MESLLHRTGTQARALLCGSFERSQVAKSNCECDVRDGHVVAGHELSGMCHPHPGKPIPEANACLSMKEGREVGLLESRYPCGSFETDWFLDVFVNESLQPSQSSIVAENTKIYLLGLEHSCSPPRGASKMQTPHWMVVPITFYKPMLRLVVG